MIMTTDAPTELASDDQIRALTVLAETLAEAPEGSEVAQAREVAVHLLDGSFGGISSAAALAVGAILKEQLANWREHQVTTLAERLHPGLYRAEDGTLYRVKANQSGERLYAERYDPLEPRPAKQFTYEKGAIMRLRPEHRLDDEHARSFQESGRI